jgi:hypothetical protein
MANQWPKAPTSLFEGTFRGKKPRPPRRSLFPFFPATLLQVIKLKRHHKKTYCAQAIQFLPYLPITSRRRRRRHGYSVLRVSRNN